MEGHCVLKFSSASQNSILKYFSQKASRSDPGLPSSSSDSHADGVRGDDVRVGSSVKVVRGCGKGNCLCCPLLSDGSRSFRSAVTGVQFECRNEAGRAKEVFSCDSKNVVYLMSCLNCGVQYVGETSQALKGRMNLVRFNGSVRADPSNHKFRFSCPFVTAHFFDPNSRCKWAEHARVQPIEQLVDHGDPKSNKDARLEREEFWIRTLRTVFPYGLNAKATNGEEKKKEPQLSIEKTFLPIRRIRVRKRGSRKNSKQKTPLPEDTFEEFRNLMTRGGVLWRHEVRKIINSFKKKFLVEFNEWLVRRENEEILEDSLGLLVMDLLKTRLGRSLVLGVPKKKTPDFIWKLHFCNPGMDFLNVPRLLRSPSLSSLIPNVASRPTVVFTRSKPIRNKIFNYASCLSELSLADLEGDLESVSVCRCHTPQFSKFVAPTHGHVMTGELEIISHSRLKELLRLGQRFRDRVPLDWAQVHEEVKSQCDSLIDSWSAAAGVEDVAFAGWRTEFLKLVADKIGSLSAKFFRCIPRDLHSRLSPPFLSDPSLRDALRNLHGDFVLVPADKAEGNVVVVCKRFYIQQVAKELGFGNEEHKDCTFERVKDSKEEIVKRVNQLLNDSRRFCKMVAPDEWQNLASFYWTAKMHKSPFSFRFITASNRCVNKRVAQVLTQCLKQVEKTLRKLHKKEKSKNHCFWIVNNSEEPLRQLKYLTTRGVARCVDTFDFSTLYTKIKHDELKNEMKKVLERAFAFVKTEKGNKVCLRPNFNSVHATARWVKGGKRKGGTENDLDCEQVFGLLCLLIDNCFISVGDTVFRQKIGIPMGADCSPLIANLFLYSFECSWMRKMKAENVMIDEKNAVVDEFTSCFRFIDDLLVLNNPMFKEFVNEIYPESLKVNQENTDSSEATFLDMSIKVHKGKFVTSLYDKRDAFGFDIVKFPHLTGNVPFSSSHGVIVSQLLRFAKCCDHRSHFVFRCRDLVDRLRSQHFSPFLLRRKCSSFFERYNHLLLNFGFHSLHAFLSSLFDVRSSKRQCNR